MVDSGQNVCYVVPYVNYGLEKKETAWKGIRIKAEKL